MEKVEVLNQRLLDTFGKFDTMPKYRVVYSEDEYEVRKTEYSDEGLFLGKEIYAKLPKYKQWIHNKFLLERLMPVPELNRDELTTKTSYEPIWVFEDKHGNPLPPKWEVIQFVIQALHNQAARSVGVKYKDPESNKDEALEIREKRLQALHEDLFGNETEVGDALAYREGVSVPTKYEGNEAPSIVEASQTIEKVH